MQQAWQNMHQASVGSGLKYKISFTGGEVTANKNFLPLVQWMRENYQDIDKIQITTNGSASLNYYLKLSQVVDSMSFSTHSEFMNEAEFFTKVLAINAVMIRPQKSLHVNVMDEHWNRDRQSMYVEWLRKNNISHSTNEINYSSGVRDVVLQRGMKNFETIIEQS
jgi:molybdenum cofactor biosynthesis enzyme MoaA